MFRSTSAWLNALSITLLGCLLLGFLDFMLLAKSLPQMMDLHSAAVLLQLAFAAGLAVILFVIIGIQHQEGSSLTEVGWRRSTTKTAVIAAALFGLFWLKLSYMAVQRWVPSVDVLELTWLRMALVPVSLFMAISEEIMMRGFFMDQLNRGGVPSWLQVLATGFCSSLYHSMQNPTLMGILPSWIIFSVLGLLYVVGNRSLTPSITAHSIVNVFGEPYLLMMVMAVIAGRPL